LNIVENNILHNIAGYIIFSIKKRKTCCDNCIVSLGSVQKRISHYSKLTTMKCYTENTLFFVNDETFNFFYSMEQTFRMYNTSFLNYDCNLRNFFIAKFIQIPFDIPLCCNKNKIVKNKIVSRYTTFRSRISSKKGRVSKDCTRLSKTMAMHYSVK